MPKSPEQLRSPQESTEQQEGREKSRWFHLAKAETALWREAPGRSWPTEKLKKEHPLSVEELQSIGYVWDELDPEVKDLAKSAFPEVAAFILHKKLEKKSIEEVRRELKSGEDIEVVTGKGSHLLNFKGMSVARAKELGHKLGSRPLTIEEVAEKMGVSVDESSLWGT